MGNPGEAPSEEPRTRSRPLGVGTRLGLVVLVLLAVVVGLTAGSLVKASPFPPAAAHSDLISSVEGVLLLVVLGFAGLGGLVVAAIMNRGRTMFGRQEGALAAGLVITALVVVIILAIGALFTPQGALTTAPVGNATGPPPGGGTVPPGGGPNGTGNLTQTNSTASAPPSAPVPPLSLPLLVAMLAAVVALVLVLPVLLRKPSWGEDASTDPGPSSGLVKGLEGALAALQAGRPETAREEILRAYRSLLEELRDPRMGDLNAATPREIEERMVTRLSLSRGAARGLREVFEEARYSTHPMTPGHARSARACLDGVLSELGARPGRAPPPGDVAGAMA
jgi:hypothetical protein